MLVDLLQIIGTYMQDVFVRNLDVWVVVGVVAQAFFTARFAVQWIASERAGRSVIPTAFWLLSLAGGAMLLIYALHRKDPVFVAGQTFGFFIYLRNVYFVIRESRV
ncbi:lipid-A-disaccharide synthase N-terminal domain-containing protein [Pseudorhodoplanes sinuspersici]|uniref:lipid-A-disaccharide synthase N-terminal domain-containing protein n=1 Tax=Pseudorhodoplanes sinuspersici TaxID=1235591 RepID=UPI000A329254|nr:lipid-A-disaccharide synthase N-terminal domain-containing protein [Pseudorhodoplanes sinuspersici]RKE68400.1 lipid-A-disaccharide synthase-like uncharacterized protein [Pseudorhodoplanes sinuspersici]